MFLPFIASKTVTWLFAHPLHLPCTCLALVCTCSHLSSICLHLFALAHTIPTSRGRCPLRGMPTAVRKYGVRFYGPWRVLVSDETLERVMFCGQAGEIVIDGMFLVAFLVAFHGTLSTCTIPLGRALSSFFMSPSRLEGHFCPVSLFLSLFLDFLLPFLVIYRVFFHCFSSHSLTPRIIGPRPQLHCPLPRAPQTRTPRVFHPHKTREDAEEQDEAIGKRGKQGETAGNKTAARPSEP